MGLLAVGVRGEGRSSLRNVDVIVRLGCTQMWRPSAKCGPVYYNYLFYSYHQWWLNETKKEKTSIEVKRNENLGGADTFDT
jgi:hypothetical protein